ncbi:unnamed protein product, partial [Mesorhabditis spiculigera]
MVVLYHAPMRVIELTTGFIRYKRLRAHVVPNPELYELSRYVYFWFGIVEVALMIAISIIGERENIKLHVILFYAFGLIGMVHFSTNIYCHRHSLYYLNPYGKIGYRFKMLFFCLYLASAPILCASFYLYWKACITIAYDIFAITEYSGVVINIAFHCLVFFDIRHKVIFSVREYVPLPPQLTDVATNKTAKDKDEKCCTCRRMLQRCVRPLLAQRFISTSLLRRAEALEAPVEPGKLRRKVEGVVDAYEDYIGIKAVKLAQAEVMEWENRLSDAQIVRREKQAEIKSIQRNLKDIHNEMDRTSRGEDRYLHLLTEEHQLIKKEKALLEAFEGHETAEREAFHQLSNRVRTSHEKERERVEKTKWWSVSASLIGALLGIIGTTIGNELRMSRLKEIVGSERTEALAQAVHEQNQKVSAFLIDMRKALHAEGSSDATQTLTIDTKDVEKLMNEIRTENERLASQMSELSRLARLEKSLETEGNVVYVGNDMQRLLDETEKKLESRMKLQTLISVVFLYAAIGVTIPLAFAFFRGN